MRHALLILALCTAPALAQDRVPPGPSAPESSAPESSVRTTAPASPATRPSDDLSPDAIRLENRRLVRDEFDPLPKLSPTKIDQVVRLKLDGGHIHVTTPLPATQPAAVDITAWPGRTLVVVGEPGSLIFHLKHVRLLDDDLTMQNTEVITGPDYLQIVRDTETQLGTYSVTLIQSRQSADMEGNPVRLLISDSRDQADHRETITGESFEKLRQTNGTDLRKEFLPILRDLGAADLLQTVSASAAWQVLGRFVTPDPATTNRIDQLLPQLSVDDFATRTKAEETLLTLGPAAAATLAQRDLTALSPDARVAVDNFLHRTQTLDVDAAATLAKDPEFLLDTAADEIDPRLTQAALARLKIVTGKSLDLPPTLAADEKQKRIEAFRSRLAPATQP